MANKINLRSQNLEKENVRSRKFSLLAINKSNNAKIINKNINRGKRKII